MKRLPPIARILLAIAALTSSTSLLAHDVQVRSAAALDGKVKCFAHTSGWTANSTGPCHTFTPPAKLAVGERFVADGNERQIGVIVASQAEQDMLGYGMDILKGEWTCVAAETLEHIPSDANQDENLTWLFIRKCLPDL